MPTAICFMMLVKAGHATKPHRVSIWNQIIFTRLGKNFLWSFLFFSLFLLAADIAGKTGHLFDRPLELFWYYLFRLPPLFVLLSPACVFFAMASTSVSLRSSREFFLGKLYTVNKSHAYRGAKLFLLLFFLLWLLFREGVLPLLEEELAATALPFQNDGKEEVLRIRDFEREWLVASTEDFLKLRILEGKERRLYWHRDQWLEGLSPTLINSSNMAFPPDRHRLQFQYGNPSLVSLPQLFYLVSKDSNLIAGKHFFFRCVFPLFFVLFCFSSIKKHLLDTRYSPVRSSLFSFALILLSACLMLGTVELFSYRIWVVFFMIIMLILPSIQKRAPL